MTKVKIVFNQTLMISTAILFGIGIQWWIEYMSGGSGTVVWYWYSPFEIIFTGFMGAVPTVLICDWKGRGLGKMRLGIRLFLHFICLGAMVSFCGYLFKWYGGWKEYLPIAVMYVLIYGFVWAVTRWLTKSDAKKINEVLKEIQDQE